MPNQVTVGVVGDIIPTDGPVLCGQGPYSACKGDFSSIFSSFQQETSNFYFLIGNFEAVLVDKIDRVTPSSCAMKAPSSVIPSLKQCNFKFLSIANNHTMEYGRDAFRRMCDAFKEAGIETFGHRDNPYLITVVGNNGIKLGMLAFSTVPALYGLRPAYYFVDFEKSKEIHSLLERLNEAKGKCDHLLVFPHWGNEFMTRPAPWQIELAHRMVDSGADAILGAHPHVLQSAHYVNEKPIFFSLGNLLSDYVQERFKRNAVVSITLDKNSLKCSNRIFSYRRDYMIYATRDHVTLNNKLVISESYEQYVAEANAVRKQVRNELIVHLLKHPHRWIFNIGLWFWLVSRFFFLVLNFRKIQKNPNAVYGGPIH